MKMKKMGLMKRLTSLIQFVQFVIMVAKSCRKYLMLKFNCYTSNGVVHALSHCHYFLLFFSGTFMLLITK